MNSEEIYSQGWEELNTIAEFDTGTSYDAKLCPSTKLIDDNNIISLPQPATTPVSLLIQSLVKELCMLVENDQQKAINLYGMICDKLHQMQLIDESYIRDEFNDMRYQYQRALSHLVKATCDTDIPLIFESSWPIQSVYSVSRYYREFEEESFIAKGGFGKVFKARNRLDDVHYAIKKVVIKAKDVNSISKHLCEVKTLASLSHPNIVPYKNAWLEPLFNNVQVSNIKVVETSSSTTVDESSEYLSKSNKTDSKFEVCFENVKSKSEKISKKSQSIKISEECKAICKFENQDNFNNYIAPAHVNLQWATLYIQMSLCDRTLKTWLDERNARSINIAIGKFNSSHLKTALDIFTQLVKGVDYIHTRGIIHHDIKPTNIFVAEQNGSFNIQLADFGLACPSQQQHSGKILGTPLYAAPEQVDGYCHKKNDLYSIGFILLELIEIFNTSMEKDKIFKLLREGHLPLNVTTNFPNIAKIIRGLAENNIEKRMNTLELVNVLKDLHNSRNETIRSLYEELYAKNIIIETQKKEISRLKELLQNNDISY